jgi:hypothetical protein
MTATTALGHHTNMKLTTPAIAALALLAAAASAQDSALPQSTDHLGSRFGLPPVLNDEDYAALTDEQKALYNRFTRSKVNFSAGAGATWIGAADLDNSPGELAISRVRAHIAASLRVSETADIAIRFDSEFSFYDFDNASGLIAGTTEPFDDARSLTITPIYSDFHQNGWAWFVGGRIQSSGESGADFSDTITGGGLGGASYQVTPSLRLGAGISVSDNLAEDDVFVLPFPIIQWDITGDLRLETAGRGARLAYQLHEDWTLALEAGFERREYRLDDNGPLPGGAVIDQSFPVALAATFRPDPRFEVVGRIGSHVYADLEFYNAAGNEIADDERDAALFAGIDLQIRF